MTSLLAEFGKKLIDRWLSTVLLPGLCFVAALSCAYELGNTHALDRRLLITRLSSESAVRRNSLVELAVDTILILIAAFMAAVAADVLSGLVNRLWTARRPRILVAYRRYRAVQAGEHRGSQLLARDLPSRASAVGDRFRLIGARVEAQYGLDVVLVWPRLWLMISAEARGEVQTAYENYRAATRLVSWGILYLVVGAYWWPAAFIGAVSIGVGHYRGQKSSALVADLVESTVDLHHKELAEALSIALSSHGRFTPDEGVQVNNLLNKHSKV